MKNMDLKNFSVKCFNNTDSINGYLNSIRKFKVPSREREKVLIAEAKNGNKKSLDELINGHQRFVFSIAKRYSIKSEDLIDYVNEGNIGLMEAIECFDLNNDSRFLTYAVHFMRRRMNQYTYMANRLIKQTNAPKFRPKIAKLSSKFFNEHGYYPSVIDLSKFLKDESDINVKLESDLYDVNVYSTDYDYVSEDKDGASSIIGEYNKLTSSENAYIEAENNEYYKYEVKSLLEKLSAREANIIKMLFGIDCEREYTTDEVGVIFHLTPARVNMIKSNVISKIRCRYYANKMVG